MAPALAALILGAAAGPALASAGTPYPDPSPTASPAPTNPNPPAGLIPTALAQAAASGKPVTVDTLTTQTHELIANPDGTLSSVDDPLPVRVQKNGAWTAIDATLAANSDGSYSPAATPSGVKLSGGGTGPVATLTDPAGHQLSYTLPFALPAPTVSGNTALYASVLPGVDLSVSVTDQGGFSDVLIVHSATAASNPDLAKLTLAASTQGLTLGSDVQGDLSATAPDGSVSFTAPNPVMWDSSTSGTVATAQVKTMDTTSSTGGTTTSSVSGPGAGAQVDPVAMSVSSGAVTLTPDSSMLTASSTSYPVYIDPYTNPDTAATGNYDEVYSSSACSGSPQFNVPQTNGEGVGYQQWGGSCGNGLERSFYTVPLTGMPTNATVIKSQITAPVTYAAANSCTENDPVTLHTTGSIGQTTDWNNQPGTDDAVYPAASTTVPGGSNGSNGCSNPDAVFTVTSQVQKLVQGGITSWTIGLFGNESQTSGNINYLRFSTKLSITTTFDVPPDTPSNIHTVPDSQDPSGAACNNGTVGWIGTVGANGLTFSADSKAEIVGEHAGINLDVWDNNTNNGSGGAKVLYDQLMGGTTGGYPITDSGGSDTITNPITPQDGHQYGWGVQAVDDSSLHLTSPWVSECHFTYDATPPSNPAVTTDSTVFPRLGNGAGTGLAGGTLTLPVTATDPLPAATCALNPQPGTTNGCPASGIAHFIWKFDTQPTQLDHAGQETSGSLTTGTDTQGNPTASASISATVPNWGVHTLYIAAVDNAGNISQVSASYSFYAPWNPAQKITPGDITGDGVPDLMATTKTGDLQMIPGDSNPDTGPTPVSSAQQTPGYNSTTNPTDNWNNYWIAHRGSLTGGAVDDLFAFNHNSSNAKVFHLYGVKNDADPGGNGKPGFTGVQQATDFSRPACVTTDASRCSISSGPALYDATDFANVKQIAAPGDVYSTGTSALITAETVPGTSVQNLWLFKVGTGPILIDPILLGTGDWSNFTLISPGTVGGDPGTTGAKPTLWARDNTTGTLYSFDLSPTATTSDGQAVPKLLTAPTTVLKSAITPPGNLCLDDYGNSSTDGNKIDIYTCNNGPAQDWTLRGDKTVRINGKCLDAANQGTTQGTLIDLWTCNGGSNQQWTEGSNGSLINVNAPTMCLADPAANTTPGTQLILWGCEAGHAEQNWAAATANGTLPTQTDPLVLPLTVPNGVAIGSPGDVNGPISTGNPNGLPDGNPDLYTIDGAGQLTEYPGAAPDSNGVATFTTTPVSFGTVTNTATDWWSLADGYGTNASDSTNNANPAALVGAATWNNDTSLLTADPALKGTNATGTNLQLDGTTGYADTSGQTVNTTGSYSVSAWVKLSTGYDTSKYYTALCQRDATGARCGFYLQYSAALHGWTLVAPSSDSTSPSAYYSAGYGNTPAAGQWTHLVGVFDATSGNMSLYVNGRLAGTGNDPTPWNATGPFLIGGADNAGIGSQAGFPGQIADVHVYNTALPPADAAALGDNTAFTWLG